MNEPEYTITADHEFVEVGDQSGKASILNKPLDELYHYNEDIADLVKKESKYNAGKIFDKLQKNINNKSGKNQKELKNMVEEHEKYMKVFKSQLEGVCTQPVTFKYKRRGSAM